MTDRYIVAGGCIIDTQDKTAHHSTSLGAIVCTGTRLDKICELLNEDEYINDLVLRTAVPEGRA